MAGQVDGQDRVGPGKVRTEVAPARGVLGETMKQDQQGTITPGLGGERRHDR